MPVFGATCEDWSSGDAFFEADYAHLFKRDLEVATWMKKKIVGKQNLTHEQVLYIFEVLTNPTVRSIVLTLRGKAGVLDRDAHLRFDANGIFYGNWLTPLASRRPYKGFRMDVKRSVDNGGSIFVHELAHWMTRKIEKMHPGFRERVTALLDKKLERIRELGKDPDSIPDEFVYFTISPSETSTFVTRQGYSDNKKDFPFTERIQIWASLGLYRYLSSYVEYVAYGIQSYFMDGGMVYRYSNNNNFVEMSRELLKERDPEMFEILDEVFGR